jgi:uroporphyrinogen-III synthase
MGMSMRVYFSRQLPNNHFLRQQEADIVWVDVAQILIEPIAFDPKKFSNCDWLFFTSPNAVSSFFHQSRVLNNQHIAALGKATAEALISFDVEPTFVGSKDSTEVANEFKRIVGKALIGFPVSNLSERTVQSVFPPEQLLESVTYHTLPQPTLVEDCHLYFFTSPSNVRAFFEVNTIKKDAIVMAIGETTSKALAKFGYSTQVPENYSVEAQYQTIFSALFS